MDEAKDTLNELGKVILQWFCGFFMCATPLAFVGVVYTIFEKPAKTEIIVPLIFFTIGYTIIVFFIFTSIAEKDHLKEHQKLVDIMAKRDAEVLRLVDKQKELKDKVFQLEYELQKSRKKDKKKE